ncbi:Hypothetical predicted protein [Mytilus galloprovincialis]|uniref:Uncharacterized protein n=1 Tax=Mytilus galloprovincialis TaxID=29158 RepID=A0A8B6FYV4_MYTGA|nr:Hypothetical predicted protein [Mytilus galloprovincialis]
MKSVFKKKELSVGKEQAIGIVFKDVGPICEKEVNLASQAESGFKLWEQIVLESENFHQFTYNQNTTDFICASTKLCVPGADEKSGGSLNEETEGVNEKELRDESSTVKPTNMVSERDFENLDRLKREEPNAYIIALEADNTQSVPPKSMVTFVIKSKNERDEIMQNQREIVFKKIENIKSKKCIKANKVFKEPVPKRKKTVVENTSKKTVENTSDIIMNVESSSQSSDMNMTGLNKCPVGKNVVVAYMDTWYPGQVIAKENNILKIFFLYPAKSVMNLFKWPEREDISEIDEMFIFNLNLDFFFNSGGRT